MKDVKEYSVKWTHSDSNRESLKFDKVGKPSSSKILIPNNYQYTVSGKCTASNSHKKHHTSLPNPLGRISFNTGRD